MKKLILILLLLTPTITFATAVPNIVIPNEVLDLGTVKTSQINEGQLLIKNTGQANLKIKALSPNCNCIEAKMENEVIAPGKESKLHISVDTTGKTGDYIAMVFVESNDPDEPLKRIKVHALISPKLSR